MSSPLIGSAGLVMSAALHVLSFIVLGTFTGPDDFTRPDDTVEFTVMEPEPEPPPELEAEPEAVAPEPEPEPEPAKPIPKPVVAAPQPRDVPPPPPSQEPPPAAEETLADFSGTTLVGEGEGGWVSAVGSGEAMNRPIGKAGAIVTGRDRKGVPGGVVGGTSLKIVPLSDLSRKPVPPSEEIRNEALANSYPKVARDQGIEGVASVRVRVLANGKVQTLATLSETYPGFGDACRKSLRDLRFEPALDKQGQPAATEFPYRCEFGVY